MARRRDEAGVPYAWVDVFSSLLVGYLLLFVMTMALMNPKAEDVSAGKILPKAEYMITMDWNNDSGDDVDLYVRDPNGKIVYFSAKESPILFLDRDDQGIGNDTIQNPDGTKTIVKLNREVVTIRAIVPGEYKINAHIYNKYGDDVTNHVVVTIVKINPYSVVTKVEKDMHDKGEEYNVVNFILDSQGNVTSMFQDGASLFMATK